MLSPPLCLGGRCCHPRFAFEEAASGSGAGPQEARPLLPPAACPALCPRAGPVSPAVTRWDPGPRLNRGCRVFPTLPWQYTYTGKKVEVAVKQAISGKPVGNCVALLNPETLDWYRHVPELQDF